MSNPSRPPELMFTRNAPRRNVVRKHDPLSSPNSVRVYRNSPEDVMLQLRRTMDYASVTLSFNEARQLAAMLLAVVEDQVEAA